MRAAAAVLGLAAALCAACATPSARAADGAPAFPAYDLEAYCHEQAQYSFAATLGDSTFDGVLAKCEALERDAMASARTLWATTAPKAATQCLDIAEGRYTYLMRCLDSTRTVRTAR